MNPALAIIAAVGVLFAIGWLLRQPAAARRQTLMRVLLVGGVFVLLLALVSGRLHPLFALMGGALALLPRLFAARQLYDRYSSSRGASGGASSKVSTRILEMTLDHDSGAMDGTVREGPFSGQRLSRLSIDELLQLLAQCRADDAQSATVLEAYLDRAHGDAWRERIDADADGGQGQGAGHGDGTMSVEQAREVLGVPASAGDDEIIAAHRKLMQKLHPDRGGSTYLAAQVNQAKEVLLKRR